ncbi:hypothetical protein [Simkania sp.]|uniref:hypothetical protein n=1 Tax=Simkania sp. TaxID=34094 RepID=UPI003B5169C6
MFIFTNRSEHCLDTNTCVEQRLPRDLKEEIERFRNRSPLPIKHGYRLPKGQKLFNQTTPIKQPPPLSTSSTLEVVANRVFDYSNYLLWTVPSSGYHWLTSSLFGRAWHQADVPTKQPAPNPLGEQISIVSIDSQLAAIEKNKSDFENYGCDRETPSLYQPSDLNQAGSDLSAVAKRYPFTYPSLSQRTFRIVKLQLEYLTLTVTRLDQVRGIISELFGRVVDEMKNSSFFQTGQQSSHHIEKVFANIEPKEIAKASREKFDALDYFSRVSTPMVNHELNGITIIFPIDSPGTAEKLANGDLEKLACKAQEILLKALEEEELCINDQGWINREQGIPNFLSWNSKPNPTLQQRLTSIVGGLILIEYFKQHKTLLKAVHSTFKNKNYANEMRGYQQLATQPLLIP